MQRLYKNHLCTTRIAIFKVITHKPFRIFVADFGKTPKPLVDGHIIKTTDTHLETLVQSNISHPKILSLIDEKNQHIKRNINTRDVKVINRQLPNTREDHCDGDKKTIAADNVDIGVDEKYHPEIRRIIKWHERLRSGQVGQVNCTQHVMVLITDEHPLKSAPYRTRPKTRGLD